jgi:hypothetical protein
MLSVCVSIFFVLLMNKNPKLELMYDWMVMEPHLERKFTTWKSTIELELLVCIRFCL